MKFSLIALPMMMLQLAHAQPDRVAGLIAIVENPASLAKYSHVYQGRMLTWIVDDPKVGAIAELGDSGDLRAVPVLERLLVDPPDGLSTYSASCAHSLYMLTGKSYEYKDAMGRVQLYVPPPLWEEKRRSRARPDLKPVDGLTIALTIPETTQAAVTSRGWLGSKAATLTVTIANHSTESATLDLSPARFVFSSTGGAGERVNVSASSLPPPQPARPLIVLIPPGQSATRTWNITKLAASPLTRGWTTSGVFVRCEYDGRVISNSVNGYYFQRE